MTMWRARRGRELAGAEVTGAGEGAETDSEVLDCAVPTELC